MFKTVVGPFEGLYIATLSCPVGEMGDRFVGYFKVYGRRPSCFCDRGDIARGHTQVTFESPDESVHHAAIQGMRTIRGRGDASAGDA